MNNAELTLTVQDLLARVDELESARGRRQPEARSTAEEASEEDVSSYSGSGTFVDGPIAWKIVRTWDMILTESTGTAAPVFSALANPTRLRIVTMLLAEVLSTAQLGDRLDQPSTGQLFHHLKELLAAGVIHQPERGVYAVRSRHVIPLLTLLSATIDVGRPADDDPE